MECEKAGGLMMKYMDGALTDAEAASLNRHVQACGNCMEDFVTYDGIISSFSEMQLTEAPEGFEYRVMDIISQLPEVAIKPVNRPLYGVLGIFTVLMGLGFVLVMNRDAMLGWVSGYPKLVPLMNFLIPVSTAVNSISHQAAAFLSQVSSYLRQAGSSLNYVPLLLFGVLAAVQYVIYRRERAVANK